LPAERIDVERVMSYIKGKSILITGAASGLGRLLAEHFSRDGGRLILWDIDKDGVEESAARIRASGGIASAYVCDVSDPNAVASTAKETGDVDILVNNAGVVSGKLLGDLSTEEIQRSFGVNVLAHFWTVRAFLPGMIERGRGHIVTIASAAGLVGSPRLTDYAATKFAAFGFDDSLRAELKRYGHPIHTTVVCPYFVRTGMFEGVRSRASLLLPLLDPEKVARRIARAVRKRRRRLILPWFVHVTFVARLLPVSWFDFLVRMFGIYQTMDRFEGRAANVSDQPE
jgi:all-trans-retinol dehydrogenase (NAD+)